jgi:hypothetical protein
LPAKRQRTIDPELIHDGFPITVLPPTHWRLDHGSTTVRAELALLVEEMVELTRGLSMASGAATVARSYKRLIRKVSLAPIRTAA